MKCNRYAYLYQLLEGKISYIKEAEISFIHHFNLLLQKYSVNN